MLLIGRDVPTAQVHIVDGGHFALDTAADHIAELVPASCSSGCDYTAAGFSARDSGGGGRIPEYRCRGPFRGPFLPADPVIRLYTPISDQQDG